jgi:hypothetical protein
VTNVEFRNGFCEALPIEDGWADVVISDGVLNLMPDRHAALREMARDDPPISDDNTLIVPGCGSSSPGRTTAPAGQR